ncbi:hypothetical protein [Sinomonas sp. G460-2]|uniref:hypothetical protein n=1 Tax=Sinomonas sp. G460-2 TaxID=3393464 RepID=UPI0039F02879
MVEERPTVTGTVSVFMGPDAALVGLDDGTVARVVLPSCGDAFDASQLLPPGLEVSGMVADGVLAIGGRNTPAEAADHAAVDTVQLALVATEKTVMLFPGLEVKHRAGADPGTVVAVLVALAGRADGKAWRLVTVEDPEPAGIVPPFVDGGEPWITWPSEPQAAPEPSAPAAPAVAAPAPKATVEAFTARPARDALAAFDAARAALEAVLGENDALKDENRHLNEAVAALNDELAGAKAKPQNGPVPTLTPGLSQEVARFNPRIAGLNRDKNDILDDQVRVLRDADRLAAELHRANVRLRGDVRTASQSPSKSSPASRTVSRAGTCIAYAAARPA